MVPRLLSISNAGPAQAVPVTQITHLIMETQYEPWVWEHLETEAGKEHGGGGNGEKERGR